MKPAEPVHLVADVLDAQLVDGTLTRCGRVDDVELRLSGGRLVVESLLTGPLALAARLPPFLAVVVTALSRRRTVAVPWSSVVEVDGGILVEPPAEELGLRTWDDRLAPLVRKLPLS